MDITGLERRLTETVSGRVGFDAGTRALYTMDASNYRQVPVAVVVARDADDAVAAVAAAREFGVPIVPRGGGTSLAGNATGGGLVLDLSGLDTIHSIDPVARTARVGPGVVLDDLRAAAAGHGLTFGPDPSTHSRCTLGGMIGNNSCGAHSVAWGTTLENVEELDVLLYDGTRLTVGPTGPADLAVPGRAGELHAALRDLADNNLGLLRTELGKFGRQVSGYPLHQLLPEHGRNVAKALVGTEGTCVIVLGATVRLAAVPRNRVLLVLGFADDVAAADAVPAILPHHPLTVESMDEQILALRDARSADTRPDLPVGGSWLFVEVGGEDAASATRSATAIADALSVPHALYTEAAEQRALWRLREEGSGISTRMADGSEAWPGWEDTAVPVERLGAYLREFRALLDRHGLRGLAYGHFGEGCIHIRIDWDLTHPEGVAAYRRFIEEGADLVARHGGTLSGEHGDGQVRAEMLPRMYSPAAMTLFSRFKAIFDPEGRMNPGMIVSPYRIDENLRFAAIKPLPMATEFAYPHDGGDFAQAMRRCIGVAKCRNHSGDAAVMCPSFRVTGEEQHSTRGRARLLYEMLAGDVITDGWRSTEVRDALDLCLSCKGCASDCPVNVDMATYKAEFLHHHYERRLRPAAHYSMGWLPLWLRLASRLPRVANALMAARPTAAALKKLGGIAPERSLPKVARRPFTRQSLGAGTRPPRGAVAGHVHELLRPADRCRGRAGAARGGLRPDPAERRGVLRPDLGVDGPAVGGPQGDAAQPSRAGPGDRRGHPGRRPGTELPVRPARRRPRADRGPARDEAGGPEPHPGGLPGAIRPDVDPTGRSPGGDHPGALPPARDPGLRRGGGAAGPRGRRRPAPAGGLLRPGRQLRLRARPLRGVPGTRGTDPATRGPRGAGNHPRPGGRLQLPHPGGTGQRPPSGAPGRDPGRHTPG